MSKSRAPLKKLVRSYQLSPEETEHMFLPFKSYSSIPSQEAGKDPQQAIMIPGPELLLHQAAVLRQLS